MCKRQTCEQLNAGKLFVRLKFFPYPKLKITSGSVSSSELGVDGRIILKMDPQEMR
jgi:hypothetical protein